MPLRIDFKLERDVQGWKLPLLYFTDDHTASFKIRTKIHKHIILFITLCFLPNSTTVNLENLIKRNNMLAQNFLLKHP